MSFVKAASSAAGPIAPRVPALERVPDADLRDVSSAVFETCSALSLSLREGDVEAAVRLYGFLVDQIPDQRSVLDDVFHPLIRHELENSSSPTARALFAASCSELLTRLRQPAPAAGPGGVLLFAADAGVDALTLQMVALLLDEARVAATLLLDDDEDALRRRASMVSASVVCVAVASSRAVRRAEPLTRALRAAGTAVVLVGEGAQREGERVAAVGAAAGGWRVGEITDNVLYLRGPLTAAETHVLRLAADGYTNVRMAHELGISMSAVKARLEGSYAKLRAADRTHAVAIALRQRWIR